MLVSVYSGLNLGLYGLQLLNLTFSSCHKSLLLETLINLTPGSLPLGSSFRFNHVSHSPPIVHHLDIVHHVLPSLADDCGKMNETDLPRKGKAAREQVPQFDVADGSFILRRRPT